MAANMYRASSQARNFSFLGLGETEPRGGRAVT